MKALLAIMLAAVSLVTAAAAKTTVEPWVYTQCGFVWGIYAEESTTAGLTKDTVSLRGDIAPPLWQFGINFHRTYDPQTMHGKVKGLIGGGGVGDWSYDGGLRGVITPEGMHGHFSLVKDFADPVTTIWKVTGTWESIGHPVAPTFGNQWPVYCLSFEGEISGPFERERRRAVE